MNENGPVEVTLRAAAVGVVLAVLLCAANVYLGLMAGMTVSASIPAAVISMGILRGLFRRGTVLENNFVQTMASAGESIAAGIIFTVPALVLGGMWNDFRFWPTLAIGFLGGLLGTLFMIPLRKTLIVDEQELKYPEGVACAEILEAGERGGAGILYIFGSMAAGTVFQLLIKARLIAEEIAGAFCAKNMLVSVGLRFSPALLSVGYIVGLNVSALLFIGGALAFLVAIPVYTFFNPEVLSGANDMEQLAGVAGSIWNSGIRYMGAGAMVTGGLYSIFKMRRGIAAGVRQGAAIFSRTAGVSGVAREEKDLPMKLILPLLLVGIAGVFVLYRYFTGSLLTASVATMVMVVAGFLFVAVSSYIVGLVGSSNNPVSGMTIFTLLLAALLLIAIGVTGEEGKMAALVVAGVVCCAACAAGDMSQDLKTGHLVGATPMNQQIAQIAGVAIAALVTTPVLMILNSDSANPIGSASLPAPQANFFKSITEAVFAGQIPWPMLFSGAGVAVLLIILDEIAARKKWPFRLYVMPVAVGVYLPISTATPILLGGLLGYFFARKPGRGVNRGVLVGSGLIAGEAVTGIAIAGLVLGGLKFDTGPESMPWAAVAFVALGVLFAALARPQPETAE